MQPEQHGEIGLDDTPRELRQSVSRFRYCTAKNRTISPYLILYRSIPTTQGDQILILYRWIVDMNFLPLKDILTVTKNSSTIVVDERKVRPSFLAGPNEFLLC